MKMTLKMSSHLLDKLQVSQLPKDNNLNLKHSQQLKNKISFKNLPKMLLEIYLQEPHQITLTCLQTLNPKNKFLSKFRQSQYNLFQCILNDKRKKKALLP